MPSFKDVFSTTWKVVVALVIIIGLGVLAVFQLAKLPSSSHSRIAPPSGMDGQHAGERRTRMPASKWKLLLDEAKEDHCAVFGMNASEVEQVLGPPTRIMDHPDIADFDTTGYKVWIYQYPDKAECIRYSGEACVEKGEPPTEYAIFSPNGFKVGKDIGKDGCENFLSTHWEFPP